SGRSEDRDVIGLARSSSPGGLPGEASVQVFLVRDGKVSGREHFLLEAAEEEDGDVMAAFLQQYYHLGESVPGEILVSVEPADAPLIERWLSERRGRRVYVRCPRRGEKRRLLEMVVENARLALEQEEARRAARGEGALRARAELQEALDLPYPPNWIECFDISNFQGSHVVASQVVFRNGQPDKKAYRKYKIRSVE